jgi:hypothetical protein
VRQREPGIQAADQLAIKFAVIARLDRAIQ